MSEVPNSRARMRLTENFPDRIVVYFSQKTSRKFDQAKGHWVLQPDTAHSSSGLGWYVGMLSSASGNVLAHELGHFKLRHVVKRMAWSALLSLGFFWLLSYLMRHDWFYQGLGVTTPSPAAALLLFSLVLPAFTFLLSPLGAMY